MNFFKKNKDTILHILLISISIILAFGLAGYLVFYYLLINNNTLPTDLKDLGPLGDYFGGLLNPTIAGLALLWLIYSVSLQIKELKKTNEALSATLETAKQQQNQVSIQNFESLFFQLLNTKNNAVNDIYSLDGTIPETEVKRYQGKDAIKYEITKFKSYLEEENWQSFYKENLLYFWGSYFRLCYQIVKLIDENPNLKTKDIVDSYKNTNLSNLQKKYFDIFRATLTQYELEAFFFNCLSSFGAPKFKNLLTKYGVFEPLLIDHDRPSENIHRLTRYAYRYDISAFEDNKIWNDYFQDVKNINLNIQEDLIVKAFKSLEKYLIIKRTYISLSFRNDLHIKSSYSYEFSDFLKNSSLDIIFSTEKIRLLKRDRSSLYQTYMSNLKKFYESINIANRIILEIKKINEKNFDENIDYQYNCFSSDMTSISKQKKIINDNLAKIKEYKNKILMLNKSLNTLKESHVTKVSLILIKYGISYTEYCDYMNSKNNPE